jgi:hypothetical protein
LVRNLPFDDQLVLRVGGDLHIIAHRNMRLPAIARLSGSVSEIWLSPLWSSSASAFAAKLGV